MRSLSILLVFLSLNLFAQEDGEWKLAKEKNFIQIFTRTTPKSKLKDSKGVVKIKASKEEALDLLLDIANHNDWMDRIAVSQVLNQVSDTEVYAYYESDAPWPVSDRDVVAHYKIKHKPDGSIVVKVNSAPDYIPVKDSYVRIVDQESSWEIIPDGDGVQIVYFNHADPGGSIPDWLANSAATDTPYKTLLEMKEKLEAE